MIAHAFKTIFVHIPKTGGQSIEATFFDRGLTPEDAGMVTNSDPARGPEELAHLYAREYRDCRHVTPEQFRSYFKFCVVRNPFERIVSEYKFAYQADGISFGSFLAGLPKPGFSDRRRHIEPQCHFVRDTDGRGLVDRIVRFERLADEMPGLLAGVFGEPVELPRLNVAADPTDFRRFYTAGREALVRKLYAPDFAYFGYRDRL